MRKSIIAITSSFLLWATSCSNPENSNTEEDIKPLNTPAMHVTWEQIKSGELEKGLNVNARDKEGNGPLWIAGNKHEIGTYLMENGADPKMENYHGNSPFNSNAVAFDYIKDPKKKDDGKRTDNIFEAIEKKDLTSIALLTVKKYDFNQLNQNGKTPLIYAIENNYLDIILLLIKNGAKTNLPDSDGNTPLSIARQLGYKEIEKILTEFDN